MTATEKNMYHVKSFIEKLGDVSKWEFNGVINDLGQAVGSCICGHQIRYEYIITNGNRREAVGSECINNFKAYNENLYDRLIEAHENWKKERAEARKKAIEAQKSEELDILKKEYKELKAIVTEKAKGYFNSRTRLPYEFFMLHKEVTSSFKEYKRTTSYIKAYKERIVSIKDFMETREWNELKSFEKVSKMNWFISLNNFESFAEIIAERIPKAKIWNPNPYKIRVYVPGNEFVEIENSVELMLENVERYVSEDNKKVFIDAIEYAKENASFVVSNVIDSYVEQGGVYV